MAERLGRIVLNNLQVTISNVYARFEDVPAAGAASAAVTEVDVDATADGAPPQRFPLARCIHMIKQGGVRPGATAWVPGEARETGCVLEDAVDFEAVKASRPEDEEELVEQLGASAYKDQFATVQHLLGQNATLIKQVTERQETAEASGSTAELEENVPLMNALNTNISKVS